MKCPDCGTKLNKVYTESKYGTAIELNQCPFCGGIWFDEWELYPLAHEKAKKIDQLDLEKLHHRNPIKQKIKICPKCGKKLEIFKDANLPKDFEIERCSNCFGLWLNQGETLKYKKYQEAKKTKAQKSAKTKTKEEKNFEEKMEKLLGLYKSSDSIGKVGRFLSTPLNSYNLKPIDSRITQEDVSAQKVAGIATTILKIILNLFARSIH